MCKVPGVGIYLACSWNSKEDPVARAEWGGRREEEVRAGCAGPWGPGPGSGWALPWEGVEAAPSGCCVDDNVIYLKEL